LPVSPEKHLYHRKRKNSRYLGKTGRNTHPKISRNTYTEEKVNHPLPSTFCCDTDLALLLFAEKKDWCQVNCAPG
jgi:hypothetical protein